MSIQTLKDEIHATAGKITKEDGKLAKVQAKARAARKHSLKRLYFKKRAEQIKARIGELTQHMKDLKTALKRAEDRGPEKMFDSVTVSNIPADAPAVAAYKDGAYANVDEARKRFPHARIVSIAVFASHVGEALDIETGDASPSQAAAWVKRQQKRGVKRPIVYANLSTMPVVLKALRAAGISRTDVRVWTAHYTGRPHLCGKGCGLGTTADATQWSTNSRYDESLCSPRFWRG